MIGAIETAILARLRAAEPALGYRWGTLAPYQGEFGAPEEGGAPVAGAAAWPLALLAYAGEGEPERLGRSRWRYASAWTLVLAARSARNDAERRLGAGAGAPGVYQLVEDARALLAGETLGLPIQPIEPGRVVSLWTKRARDLSAAVYALDLEIRYEADAPAGGAIDELRHLYVAWDVPPHQEPAPQAFPLPPAAIDAADDIPLPPE